MGLIILCCAVLGFVSGLISLSNRSGQAVSRVWVVSTLFIVAPPALLSLAVLVAVVATRGLTEASFALSSWPFRWEWLYAWAAIGALATGWVLVFFTPRLMAPAVTEESVFAASVGFLVAYFPLAWSYLPAVGGWMLSNYDSVVFIVALVGVMVSLYGIYALVAEVLSAKPIQPGRKVVFAGWYLISVSLIVWQDVIRQGSLTFGWLPWQKERGASWHWLDFVLASATGVGIAVLLFGMTLGVLLLLESNNAKTQSAVRGAFLDEQMNPLRALTLTCAAVLPVWADARESAAGNVGLAALVVVALQGYNFFHRKRGST